MSITPALPARVARLFVYPIKSCAGIELPEATLTETGLAFDRALMLVDEAGRFVSQRELPRMALIRPRLEPRNVAVRAPGMPLLRVGLEVIARRVRVRVWDDEVDAFDTGGGAAQWFSSFLGRPLRLVRFDPAEQRRSSREWTGDVVAKNLFSDGFPLLVTSEASVGLLNERLGVDGHAPVGVERFRPNLVLADVGAHDEDRFEALHIDAGSGVELRPVKPCARCIITDVDPVTGELGSCVREALAGYRRDERRGGVTFGMNAIVTSGVGEVLRVGQSVVGATSAA